MQPLREFGELAGILACRFWVVDGAGADDGKHAVVATVDDVAGLAAAVEHQRRYVRRDRQFLDHFIGRPHLLHAGNANVVGVVLHVAAPLSGARTLSRCARSGEA